MKYVHGGDIYSHKVTLDFSANINPLGTPPEVLRAAQNSLLDCAHYPDSSCRRLRKAITDTVKKESGNVDVAEEFVICGNGAADLIFNLVLALKPKKALLLAPTFAEYEQALKTVNCEIDYYLLKETNQFAITDKEGNLPEDFFSSLNLEIDICFVCNPNNPTGQPIKKSKVLAIVNWCIEHDIFLVVDECFNDFLDQPEEYSILSEITQYANVFILRAFTKMYAMAGLRLGYGFCSNLDLLDLMLQYRQPWNVSIPAQEAGIRALQELEFVEKTRLLIQTERTFLKAQLGQMGAIVYGSEANYIFFQWMEQGSQLFQLCKDRKILIRSCGNYRGLNSNYYRISVRTHKENVQLVDNLWEIVKELGITTKTGGF